MPRRSDNDWVIVVLILVALWYVTSKGGIVPGPAPPIPGQGFRVLIVEETLDRSKLPVKQLTALTSTKVESYLDAKCAKGADGSAEWQRWDDDISTAKMNATWQAAMAKYKETSAGATPWVIISNGSTGFSGPLPQTEDDFLALLQKYGGA